MKHDKMMHEMPLDSMLQGVSGSLFQSMLVLLLGLTLLYILGALLSWNAQRQNRYFRFNLLGIRFIKRLVQWRGFQFALQVGPVFLLFLIIATGLFGVQSGGRNLAPVLTWTIWWALIIFDIVLLGRMWCLVCPWYALSTWLRRLTFWRRQQEPFSLNLKWPRWLSNIYLAVFLFVLLTWLELGFDVTANPLATAVLALIMTALVLMPALVFEKMSFCRYGCMIGRICGLYSMFAPVEVRPRETAVCTACKTRDCRLGNERGYPCPTSLDVGRMQENTYCTVCTECVKSCPSDNVAFNLRSFGADLLKPLQPKPDEALMALVLLSLTSFHGLTMTPAWFRITDALQLALKTDYLTAFSLGMAGILLIPTIFFGLFSILAARLVGQPTGSDLGNSTHPFWHYAYALIPVALFYHLAHNAHHLAMEGAAIMPVLSDPFGWGWDLFGTASWEVVPLLSEMTISWVQLALLSVGHFYGLRICLGISRRRHARKPQAFGAMAIYSLALWVFTLCNLWLLTQPMVMRTSM